MTFRSFTAILALVALGLAAVPVLADGPADNAVANVRRIPKLGVEVPDADRAELQNGLAALANDIQKLKANGNAQAQKLLPDVLIFHRAVDQALQHREFFDTKEIPVAKALLREGRQRAEQLLAGNSPWTQQKGLVVRGYISRIDKTVQPYGLVIPDDYDPSSKRYRLDLWFHGRGETLSEVNFLNDRTKNKGQFAPPETIVLHPYGRYCNANKFAGEIDTFEALDSVQGQYSIDPDRISVRGFSMGGAACWQFAVHYPDRWFAANPGAGFSETPDFLKVFQNETLTPSWYEQKLWRMYDCPGYAANLAHLHTVAYSGEIDKQKQAADLMEAAFEREGMKLLHIIGPMTAHSIHKESAKEIESKMTEWAKSGIDHAPSNLQLVTFTLKYNRMHWLTIDGMKEHWEEARVVVKPVDDHLNVQTKNISALTIRPPKGLPRRVRIDAGKVIDLPAGSAEASLVLGSDGWQAGQPTGLRKKHNLQGPIDDAFMDSFLFVTPSGKCPNEAVESWVKSELDHAVTHWRQQMRGDAVVKKDSEVTDQDIASSHLVLWGDPISNSVLNKIADKLPISWKTEIRSGSQSFEGANHALIAIHPNPLNPEKYVVLNSSFTYREYDYLNNARQTSKLPDWAIVDVRTPPNSRFPGKIVAADFFDERWQVKPAPSK